MKDKAFADNFDIEFNGEWQDLTVHFPKIATAKDVDDDTTQAVDERRSLNSFAAFLNVLGSEDQPAIVFVDDCQWVDDLTLKVLSHWHRVRTNPNVMLVASFRGDEVLEDEPLRRLNPATHIKLGPLADQDIRELAQSMAGELPASVLDFIVSVSNGSPFMASAVVRGLVECSAITREAGDWQINQAEFDECLSSQKSGEFLTRRLESLDAKTLELLASAAALGRGFELDIAAVLCDQRIEDAIPRLNEARNRNLVWYQSRSNRYLFPMTRSEKR